LTIAETARGVPNPKITEKPEEKFLGRRRLRKFFLQIFLSGKGGGQTAGFADIFIE